MYDSFATPWTPGSYIHEIPKQEYWSRLPFISWGDLPPPGIKPTSPAPAGGFSTTEPTGKPIRNYSVQYSSVTQLRLTLCDPMDCSTLGLPVHHQLPEFTQTHVHWVSGAIQPSHPLSSLLLLPSIFPSIMVFSNVPVLHIKRQKDWSFSFSISSSNEYSELISFRIDWLDLLAVQGTLKSLLQHHS